MYGNNICKFIFLGFVIVHNDQMWQGIKDLLSLIVTGYMGIVLFVLTLIFFTIYFRALFFNRDDVREAYYKNSPMYSESRWDTWYMTMYTLFMASIGDNFPDLTYPFNTRDTVVEVFSVIFYMFFMSNIIVSILQGYFGDCYGTRINNRVQEMLACEPELYHIIMKCREAHILENTMIREAYYTWSKHGKKALAAIEYEPLESPSDELEQLYFELENSEKFSDKKRFLLFYKSKATCFFLFCMDLFIAFIPIIKLDTFSTTAVKTDWYLISELFNFMTFVEYFLLKFAAPKELKGKFFKFRLMGAAISFLAANFLQYSSYDVTQKEIYCWKFVFKVWGFASLTRFCGVHHLLQFSGRWLTLLRVFRMCLPLLKDLLQIYLLILLIFGQVGLFLYGGNINSNLPAKYNTKTGGGINDNYVLMNFNDTLNSMYYLFVLIFGANFHNILMICISSRDGMVWSAISFVFFTLYFMIGLMLVLNIIVSMILGFIGDYFSIYEDAELEKDGKKEPFLSRAFGMRRRQQQDKDKKLK